MEAVSRCVGAQGMETTGVKQLSALSASGEKMLLNQEGFSDSPSLQGNSKTTGQRSARAAMEAICLVVTAQQVRPRWVGGPGFSKHLTRQEKKKKKRE